MAVLMAIFWHPEVLSWINICLWTGASVTSYFLHPLLWVALHFLQIKQAVVPLTVLCLCFFVRLVLSSSSLVNMHLFPSPSVLLALWIFAIHCNSDISFHCQSWNKTTLWRVYVSAVFPGHVVTTTSLRIQLTMNSSVMELIAYVI